MSTRSVQSKRQTNMNMILDNHMPLGHTTTVHLVPRPKVQGADPPGKL